MLRCMLCKRIWPNEERVDFLKHTTSQSENIMQKAGYDTWVEQQRQKKWHFAGKSARHHNNKWCKLLFAWRPLFRCMPRRNLGHPHWRWDDSISNLAGGDWPQVAMDADLWGTLMYEYVKGDASH